MRPVQSARRNRVLAAMMSSFVALGAIPLTVDAAPPVAKPTASKAPTKTKPGDKSEDPKRGEARKAYAEGEAKFQAGDYQAAFDAYKTANDAVPAPMTAYKMALSLDRLDRPADALAAYNTFLTSSPPASMDAKVADAQARVADLKTKAPAVIKVTSQPAGASVVLDGSPQTGVTPLDLKTTPGQHVVRVTAPEYDAFEKTLELQGGTESTVEAVLARTPPPPPPPPPAPPVAAEKPPEPPPERRSNTAAFVVLGVAGAGAVVGTIFGVKALQDKSDFDNGAKTTDQADSVEKNALISDMAFGAALTLGITGTVLLLTNGTNAERASVARPRAFELVPSFSPQRAGAAATFRF